MSYQNISPAELQTLLGAGEQIRLIDVREPEEYEAARIEAAELLPLSRFHEWMGSLAPDAAIVFMCHHGMRSAHVCEYLSREGFSNLRNLAGGIDRWSLEVDRGVPRY